MKLKTYCFTLLLLLLPATLPAQDSASLQFTVAAPDPVTSLRT